MNLNLQTPRKQAGFVQFIPAIVAGVSAAAGAVEGGKARKKQNAARANQQQVNRIRNFQSKRQYLRNFRVAQAEAVKSGLVAGTSDSSFARATQSSQQTQARVAGTEFDEMTRLGEAASSDLNAAANASFRSGLYATASQFALSDVGQDLIKAGARKVGIT